VIFQPAHLLLFGDARGRGRVGPRPVRPSPPWLPWFPEAARWPRDGDVDGADRATRGDNALVEAAGSWKLGWWKARTASGSRLRLASRASPTPHEPGEYTGNRAPPRGYTSSTAAVDRRGADADADARPYSIRRGTTGPRHTGGGAGQKVRNRTRVAMPTRQHRQHGAHRPPKLCAGLGEGPHRLGRQSSRGKKTRVHCYVARIHKFAHKNKLLCLLPKHMSATTRCQQRRYRHLFAVHIHSLMHRAIRRQQKNSKTKEKDMHHIPSAQRRQDVYYHSSTMEREKDVP
jgi:hypothetical protein